jgi:dienelactone hydrolase
VIVTGYPDPGYIARMGCAQGDMAQYVSWAEHLAAAGFAVVAYRNERADDARALLRHVYDHADLLGVAADRLALFACSGSAPTALRLAMDPGTRLRCAALCYGYLLDVGGADGVAAAARTWGFADAAAGRSVADLPGDTALLVVRAGADAMPDLNPSLDRFVAAALARDLPLTLVNVSGAPHAFDIERDDAGSRAAIAQIVAFFRAHLQRG